MRTNKVALSLALAGILVATNVLAEESGWFVGAQLGYSSVSWRVDHKADFKVELIDAIAQSTQKENKSAISYGILGGYKQFFTPEFGARYYGSFYYAKYTPYNAMPTYNFNANVDALYNFAKLSSVEFGVFGGLSLGYVSANNEDFAHYDETIYYDIDAKGFDLGLNFGLRASIAEHHGVELYSRFGFLEQKGTLAKSFTELDVELTQKIKQPYQFGIRYVFSF